MASLKIYAAGVLLGIYSMAFSQSTPADSVISPSLRGTSSIRLELLGGGATSLLHGVNMASQVNDNVFVDYGPFINGTPSDMTVSLISKGMDGRRTVVAHMGAGVRYESSDSLTFVVPSGREFAFSVKDFAEITVSVAAGVLDMKSTGIPSATDFSDPSGKYLGCVQYGYVDDGGATQLTAASYYYEAGSMSDKSVRKDYTNSVEPRVTQGRSPANPGVCKRDGF